MKKFLKIVFFVLVILLVTSCGGKYMIKQDPISKPEPGKALVNFVRPSFFGKAVRVSLWDGDKLVGISYGKQAFQYECDPGNHLFIAWSEYKSPVEAELLPDHAYYIVLQIRMGVWRGRIHQVPVNKHHELWAQALEWQKTLPNFTFDRSTLAAMESENKQKIDEYLTYYGNEVKGTKHMLVLRPEDGVPIE